MGLIDLAKARARADRKTMVLSESMDRRTWKTAGTILEEDITNLIIIGTPEDIAGRNKGLDVSGATVINPQTYEKAQEYIDLFIELRKPRGMTPEKAKGIIMSNYVYYGRLVIKNGDADGSVSGACHSMADTLRPCLQIVKTRPDTELVSTFFLMVVPDCEYGAEGIFIFTDSGLNRNLNPGELTATAKSSADPFELLVQKEAGVAMLSHSTKGPAKHPDVDKVMEAAGIVEEPYPELKLDEELQLDVALISEVTSSKAPGSEVAGKANVLAFPDPGAGNIGYKLIQRLAKVGTYGPITQGIAKPANDLSGGCCTDDIVGAVAITAVQAQAE